MHFERVRIVNFAIDHSCVVLSLVFQAAISLEEDGANIVSSTLADELLGAPFASMAPRSSGAHVGR
jgi:hypothetical protein